MEYPTLNYVSESYFYQWSSALTNSKRHVIVCPVLVDHYL